MVAKLEEYYPSGINGPARIFGTGEELDQKLVSGLLHSLPSVGESKFQDFVKERLFISDDGTGPVKSIFDPIKRSTVSTGLKSPTRFQVLNQKHTKKIVRLLD